MDTEAKAESVSSSYDVKGISQEQFTAYMTKLQTCIEDVRTMARQCQKETDDSKLYFSGTIADEYRKGYKKYNDNFEIMCNNMELNKSALDKAVSNYVSKSSDLNKTVSSSADALLN